MFTIYGGNTKLTQWTKDNKLIMDQLPIGAEVLFYNDHNSDDPLITEVYEIVDESGNTSKVCDVPNILLTETNKIKVGIPAKVVGRYGVVHSYAGQREKYFEVEAAEKPENYVYEETSTEGLDWNNLRNKPFYTEEEVILERQIVDGFVDKFGLGSSFEDLPAIKLVDGEKYVVFWDGQSYELSAIDNYGNVRLSFGDNIFEPFMIVSNEEMLRVSTNGINSSHEIGITCVTTHTLDSKYLPCDLLFKVGCTTGAHPKMSPANMTKPIIVSGSLESVLTKLANGEIPVVKVQYQAFGVSGGMVFGYGGEFTCDTLCYRDSVVFCHDIPKINSKMTVQINMNLDDLDFIEMWVYPYATDVSSPLVID